MNNKHSIKEEHADYYQYLEKLRKSGITNMWGASPYLAKRYALSQEEAGQILAEWIQNYDELCSRFNWR